MLSTSKLDLSQPPATWSKDDENESFPSHRNRRDNGLSKSTDLWHPAFRPSGVMNSDVSEVTETDENILIPNARDAPRLISDDVLERAPPAWEVITEYVATSLVVAVICVTFAFAFVNVMFPDEWALIGLNLR
jgi:hypothetical protein